MKKLINQASIMPSDVILSYSLYKYKYDTYNYAAEVCPISSSMMFHSSIGPAQVGLVCKDLGGPKIKLGQ